MKKRAKISVAISIVVLTLIGCNKNGNEVIASGTFESVEVTISSEMNGKLTQFTINEGDKINSGDIAAEIDTVQLDLKRKLLKASRSGAVANLPNTRTDLAVIDLQITTAHTEKERIQRLVSSNAAPEKQLDDITNQLNLLHKQKSSMSANLKSKKSAVRAEIASIDVQITQINDQINRAHIISPIDGTVLRTFSEPGEFIAAGKPLFTVANLDTMELRAYITANQLNTMKLGQEVIVMADGNGKVGKKYKGRITWISSDAEFTPKTVLTKNERANLVYAIKVTIKNDGYLRIGMYGTVIDGLN